MKNVRRVQLGLPCIRYTSHVPFFVWFVEVRDEGASVGVPEIDSIVLRAHDIGMVCGGGRNALSALHLKMDDSTHTVCSKVLLKTVKANRVSVFDVGRYRELVTHLPAFRSPSVSRPDYINL
jgi:hypothetical protein